MIANEMHNLSARVKFPDAHPIATIDNVNRVLSGDIGLGGGGGNMIYTPTYSGHTCFY